MGNQEKIEGYIKEIVYKSDNEDYIVFVVEKNLISNVCVGNFSNIFTGQYIIAFGNYKEHKTYGLQFSIESFEIVEPGTEKDFINFISSGILPGIGAKKGEKIAKVFGKDSYRIMLENPTLLANNIKGITLKKAYEYQEILIFNKEYNDAFMYLNKFGISANLTKKIYDKFRGQVYKLIKNNPYILAEEIKGVGFKKADEIAKRMGIVVDSSFRIRAAILYVLEKAVSSGHTYFPLERLKEEVKNLLLIEREIDAEITELTMDGKIVAKYDEKEEVFIYITKYYNLENYLASNLKTINESVLPIENVDIEKVLKSVEEKEKITLDETQISAVKSTLLGGITVITGGPGTGKTTIINTIIKVFIECGSKIALAAPTGRAAKRMSETCHFEAKTIHRMLGYMQSENEGLNFFDKNRENPLEEDVIIIDEMSMVDLPLMNTLLLAIEKGTRLILVGDEDQLPSVGVGQVLADLISSNCFNVIRLTKIFRQSSKSDIISNAHKVNGGKIVDLKNNKNDFLFIERDSPEKIISAIYTLIKEKLPKYVGAKSSELQILTPSKAGKTGVLNLNNIMQNLLNPKDSLKNEKVMKNITFREGDKVMQIKNDYNLSWYVINEDGLREEGVGVFNGDTGKITEINTFAQTVDVIFDDGRICSYDFKNLDNLDLAYAITIHKSQGSEYPAVIIPLYYAPRLLMNRKLLYTAITRARKCVCLVGIENCFETMANNINDYRRYSTLSQKIREVFENGENDGFK